MVKKTVLDNGLVVLSELMPGFNSCAMGIWVKTGSRYENDQQAGMSHFMEHMFFKGTERRTATQIAQEMDGLGGQINAFTEKEHTCFYARVIDRHYGQAFDVLSDMLLHSRFAEEELAREKGVIVEEINMYEDTPSDVVFELFHRTMWGEHPLALPILGNVDSVRGFSRADFLDYLKQRYTSERIVVAVAGNISHEKLVDDVSSWELPRASEPVNLTVVGVPAETRNHALRYRDEEQAKICW